MRVIFKHKQFIVAVFVVLILLLIPFDIDQVETSVGNISIYKAGLYTLVRYEIFGIVKSKICFFPSNFDLNNNFDVMYKWFDNPTHSFTDFLSEYNKGKVN